MKKINVAAFIIISLAVLALFFTAVFFQFFTYGGDGKIQGDWRANETMMYLGTARTISLITGTVILLGIVLFIISQDKLIRKQNIFGILFIALGTFIIIGSLNWFYPCTDMMRMNDRPMRCYWTMKDMLGVAGAISIIGALMLLFNKSKELLKGLNIAVIILGCLYFLIPVKMTGFCLSAMTCIERYKPFTLMMSFLIIILSVINAFLLYKNSKRKA